MRMALLVMDGQIEKRAYRLEAIWRDPSTPTFAAKADGVVKLATAITSEGRALLPVEQARIELGYGEEARRQMRQWDKDSHTGQLNALFSHAPGADTPVDLRPSAA